jgi:hypothetical protein
MAWEGWSRRSDKPREEEHERTASIAVDVLEDYVELMKSGKKKKNFNVDRKYKLGHVKC